MRQHDATRRLGFLVTAIILTAIVALALGGCVSQETASSWVDLTTGKLGGTGEAGISCIAFDPTHDILFAGTGDGVSRCTSPRTNPIWTKMAGGTKLEWISTLLYEPTHSVLYAAGGPGVYRWTNPEGSGAWTTTNGVGNNISLAYDPEQNILYSGTGAGPYRCADPTGSPSWAQMEGGARGAGTGSLLYDQGRHVLFAATNTQGKGVWKYQDETWTNLDVDFASSDTIGGSTQLAYDSRRDVLYQAGLNHSSVNETPITGIKRCENATTAPSWSLLKGQNPYYFSPLAYDKDNDVLHAGAFVARLPELLERNPNAPEPPFNKSSHGLFSIADPSSEPMWTNAGGPAKSSDVTRITLDPVHHCLYVITPGALWRYTPPTQP